MEVEATGEEVIGEIVPSRYRREERVDKLRLLQDGSVLFAGPDEADDDNQANCSEDREGNEEALKEGKPRHAIGGV